jgi:hypothetical protein
MLTNKVCKDVEYIELHWSDLDADVKEKLLHSSDFDVPSPVSELFLLPVSRCLSFGKDDDGFVGATLLHRCKTALHEVEGAIAEQARRELERKEVEQWNVVARKGGNVGGKKGKAKKEKKSGAVENGGGGDIDGDKFTTPKKAKAGGGGKDGLCDEVLRPADFAPVPSLSRESKGVEQQQQEQKGKDMKEKKQKRKQLSGQQQQLQPNEQQKGKSDDPAAVAATPGASNSKALARRRKEQRQKTFKLVRGILEDFVLKGVETEIERIRKAEAASIIERNRVAKLEKKERREREKREEEEVARRKTAKKKERRENKNKNKNKNKGKSGKNHKGKDNRKKIDQEEEGASIASSADTGSVKLVSQHQFVSAANVSEVGSSIGDSSFYIAHAAGTQSSGGGGGEGGSEGKNVDWRILSQGLNRDVKR